MRKGKTGKTIRIILNSPFLLPDASIASYNLCSLVTKEITAWTVSHILDSEKHVIVTKVIPELVNGILTGLRDINSCCSEGDDDNGEKNQELMRGLKDMRTHFLYIVEVHRTKVCKINEDAFNELIELLTSAVLSILSKDISKVSVFSFSFSRSPFSAFTMMKAKLVDMPLWV